MTAPTELIEQARAWAAEDPDDQTRTELEALVAARRSAVRRPTWPTGSPAPSSSARRACAARSAPVPTG